MGPRQQGIIKNFKPIRECMLEIKSIRNLNRFRHIVWVLLKYGFDDVIHRLDLPGSFILKRISRVKGVLTVNERIRMVFQDLGPTFIKFGQILSMRPDLVPGLLVLELKKLQDQVPPAPQPAVQSLLEKALGRPSRGGFFGIRLDSFGIGLPGPGASGLSKKRK